MKVLLTSLGFYPAFAWGGPVKIVYQNAQELRRRGHEVTVCCSNLLDKKSHIAPGTFVRDVDGIRAVYMNTYTIPQWPGSTGPTIATLNGLKHLFLEVERADVIHINGARDIVALASALFACWLNKPFVVQPHGILPQILNSQLLKRIFDKLFGGVMVKRASALIAGQNEEAKQIMAAGADPSRIHIVANGLAGSTLLSVDGRKRFREAYHIPIDNIVLLFLGRINYKKGTDLLVKAFSLIKHSEHISLVIAGPDDGQLAEVKSLVCSLKLEDRTVFTGLLSGEEVMRAYAASDLFILPCRIDTFPMAIIEACSNGLPVIVSETCEIAHIVHGVAGVAVPVGEEEFAQAIEDLLQDEVRQASYSQGGKRLLETEFSIQAIGDKLEKIYSTIIE